ncbi:MAG: ISNCY family transposase [Myxococcales bacterium]
MIGKALAGSISWLNAAAILGVTARHMRRIRRRFEIFGKEALRDGRRALPRRRRVPDETVSEILRLRREVYADFSIRHLHEHLVERHHIALSYTYVRDLLLLHGLADKCSGVGRYLRKRERRPIPGLLVHLDASTHQWIAELPTHDLVVALDDADGRILFARFFPQEGVGSSMAALLHIVRRYGRFAQLYTDRGSHFCRTERAGDAPADEQHGQVTRVLRALGIEHIRAMTPEARGRSERCFGTLQGRLPQELRLHGITSYESANRYLDDSFIADFNRRFSVRPRERGSAFTPLTSLDLELLVSAQHERIVQKDNTVVFARLFLQLPPSPERIHYARCPVLVHELVDDTLAVSFHGKLIGRFDRQGTPLALQHKRKVA